MSNQEISKSIKSMSELMAGVDEHIYNSLKTSVYPGAKDESIAMVISYCKAKKYDPLAKPCYIVPMSVKDSKTGNYEYRDVILPGIAAYRIDAHRTGMYSGLSKPTFGPLVTEKLDGKEFTYPESCEITVKKRMIDGYISEFTAEEFWKENYATKGKDKKTGVKYTAPNDMWEKRARGQLAKCAEAQALRKAFPEAVGNLPTFEEIEGKSFKMVDDKVVIEDNLLIDSSQLEEITKILEDNGKKEIDVCAYLKIESLESMKSSDFFKVKKMFEKKQKVSEKTLQKINNTESENNVVEVSKDVVPVDSDWE